MTRTETQTRSVPSLADAAQIQRLRAGDERTFEALVDHHHASMLSIARMYVKTRADAEEVVQDAWVGVLKGLDRFEGRSSLKTWILRIVANTAMTRGKREARSMPFSSLLPEGEEAAVDPDRFRPRNDAFPGHWNGYPADWRSVPEDALLGRETLAVVQAAIAELPQAQQTVITLRDIQGCSADEVCEALELSPANQRVLLHRARSRVRAALEGHLGD